MENYEIPNGAVLGGHEEHHDEGHDEDHEEHDDDHDGEHEGEHGEMDTLANSDIETTSHRLGLSTTGDWGYVGVSYSDLSSTCGIPFHSEAAHDEHGEEHEGEHHDDHDEDDHDDHDEDGHAGHEEHGEERIFSKTESEIFALSGSVKTAIPFVNTIDFAVKNTDYELTEQHAEGEHGDEDEEGEHSGHDHAEGPTVFSNEATEVSVSLDLSRGERIRRVVLNYADEEISIIGAEAFMAPVERLRPPSGFQLG